MADKCLVRIEDSLSKSGLNKDEAESILKAIREAESKTNLKEADDAVNAAVAKEIKDKAEIQPQRTTVVEKISVPLGLICLLYVI